MACIYVVFLLFFVSFEDVGAQEEPPAEFITLESATLSPTIQPTSWLSPSGLFAFGFYPQGSDFLLGIWLMDKERTLSWTAHRDDPPVPLDAKLLTINGKLLLRTRQSEEKVIVESASFALMRDSGNFVVYNKSYHVNWESFKFPTDTILGGQNLTTGVPLFSSLSETNHSTGRFRLDMQADGNLVLYFADSMLSSVDAYWASNTWKAGNSMDHQLYLNDTTGGLVVRNSTNLETRGIIYKGSSSASKTIYSARLSYNGMFQVYSHSFDSNGNDNKTLAWSAVATVNQCQVKGFCGLNSYCTQNDIEPYCYCLPGTDFVDSKQMLLGCLKNFTESSCNNISYSASYHMVREDKLVWDDLPYFKETMTIDECSNGCLEDCNCDVALYDQDGHCSKRALPLKYAKRSRDVQSSAFFKVGVKGIEMKNDTIFFQPLQQRSGPQTWC